MSFVNYIRYNMTTHSFIYQLQPFNVSMDGWLTCDVTSFSTAFQSYQDDERLIMKGCVQWNRAGLEFTTARSVGQRLKPLSYRGSQLSILRIVLPCIQALYLGHKFTRNFGGILKSNRPSVRYKSCLSNIS